MLKKHKAGLQTILIAVLSLCFHQSLWAATLPEYTQKIADGVYSYGDPEKGYYSMFVVTTEGVIAIESVNSRHATGLLNAINEVTTQPVRYLLHSHNHWDHAASTLSIA
ncbi:MAG: hypothetical protein V7731_11680 [Amphritea sp.]